MRDKMLHIGVSAMLVVVAYTFILLLSPIYASVLITMIVGIGKEVMDRFIYRGKLDWLDIASDLLGVLLVLILFFFIYGNV